MKPPGVEGGGTNNGQNSDIHRHHFPWTLRDQAIWPLRLASQDLSWLLAIGRIANTKVDEGKV
jgi:hypothetical protein